MDDIRQKDLSNKAVQDMSPEERQEMKRRFEEFAAAMKGSTTDARTEKPAPEKKVVKWDPRKMGKNQDRR